MERPWTRAAPEASRGGRAMSQAALSRTQQQLLPQVGGGATRERHHCLAHSTRLQLHGAHATRWSTYGRWRGVRTGSHTLRAATSVGEVPAATFSGGYLPRGGEQVATVVLCCKALRALGEVKWFSAHQALAESFPGGSTQPTGAWTTHHLPNAVSMKMPEASTCVWAPIHLWAQAEECERSLSPTHLQA